MKANEDKIFISNNRFIVDGFCNEKFSSLEELENIIKIFFAISGYNTINLFKMTGPSGHRRSTRIGVIVSNEYIDNAVIICEKPYMQTLKDSLRN